MGKHKYSKGLGFLHIRHSSFSPEIETHTIPKTWESRILIVREPMGKHKHFKAIGLIHISCEAFIHTIPKIWEKWIPIVRKKYVKIQTFQSERFITFFTWSGNLCVAGYKPFGCPDIGEFFFPVMKQFSGKGNDWIW